MFKKEPKVVTVDLSGIDKAGGLGAVLGEIIAAAIQKRQPQRKLDLGPLPEGYVEPFQGDSDERFVHIAKGDDAAYVAMVRKMWKAAEASMREDLGATDDPRPLCPACFSSSMTNAMQMMVTETVRPDTRAGMSWFADVLGSLSEALGKRRDEAIGTLHKGVREDAEIMEALNGQTVSSDSIDELLARRDATEGPLIKDFKPAYESA